MTTIDPSTGRLNSKLTVRRPVTPIETQSFTIEQSSSQISQRSSQRNTSRPATGSEEEGTRPVPADDNDETNNTLVNLDPNAKALLMGEPLKSDLDSDEETQLDPLAEETPVQRAMRIKKRKEQTAYTALNTPMLVAMLRKTYAEEPSARSGLGFILKHCQKGEGCVMSMKHSVIDVILKIQRYDEYKNHSVMQLLVVSIFRRLLECNYTRDAITYKTEVLKVAFTITHRFMGSTDHVEMGVNCILQCCRSEICRMEIMDLKMISYCMLYAKKHWKRASLVRAVLKTFNWVPTTAERMDEICRLGAIETTVELMKRHSCDPVVLAPAVGFLTKAASVLEWCMNHILEQRLIPLIITSLRALHNEEELQLEGLKILQTLSTNPEGYKQISETRGGWQSICQGTSLGNALFHELEGEFHNPGWAIGDTPNLTMLDRQKQLAVNQWQKKYLGLSVKYAWTSRSVMEYMGLSMNAKTLPSVVEYNEAHFELLRTLDLLPKNPGEDRGIWFNRIAAYEKDNELKIEDMVKAVLDMKKKDQKRLELEELIKKGLLDEGDETSGNFGGEKVKPVYVNGQRITMQAMAENDAAADELANL